MFTFENKSTMLKDFKSTMLKDFWDDLDRVHDHIYIVEQFYDHPVQEVVNSKYNDRE